MVLILNGQERGEGRSNSPFDQVDSGLALIFFWAMNYVEKLLDGVHSVLNINAATFSGSIDVIAVEQQDGTHPSVSSCFDQGRGI